MENGAELIDALNQLAKEKGIDKEIILEAIETSLVSACKKNFGQMQNVKVVIDRTTGAVYAALQKDVVEEIEDEETQITLEEAKEINPNYQIGDIVDFDVTLKDFGRISAQTAKQVVVQKIREAERELLFDEYVSKEREIMTGIVQRRERKNVIVQLGKTDAVMPPQEQVPNEEYFPNQRIRVYVCDVKQTTKGPQINISRAHPEIVRRLFEQEVPEVKEGLVEIKSISREPGSRTKIAVLSTREHIDPIGACVGQSGVRVNVVVEELNGEKIDVIAWSPDPRKYISSALSPSKVSAVWVDDEEQSAKVIVPDNQLSLAIGREGQNVRLAAKLTGWKIDIKSESQAKETDLYDIILEAAEKERELGYNKYEEEFERQYREMYEQPTTDIETSEYTDSEYYDDDYYDDEYDDYDDEYYDEEYSDYEDDGYYDEAVGNEETNAE
ncbi:MAG: transcription termination factor NusA [Defluviitaleaceae bacterium]|nr:transcription termination factor NusA [Defluviitaleaceae bacterium]